MQRTAQRMCQRAIHQEDERREYKMIHHPRHTIWNIVILLYKPLVQRKCASGHYSDTLFNTTVPACVYGVDHFLPMPFTKNMSTGTQILYMLGIVCMGAYWVMCRLKSNFMFFPCRIDSGVPLQLPLGISHCIIGGLGDTPIAVYYRTTPDPALPYVLYSHGSCTIVEFESMLLQRSLAHMNIVAFDYRGYGRSDGVPSEYAVDLDLDFLLEWMTAHYSVPRSNIVLWGRSLGTNIVMRYIGNPARQDTLPNRVFLFTPFTRYSDVLRRRHFPAPLLAHAVGNMDVMPGVARYLSHAPEKRRMLVIAMRHDFICPYANAEEIRDTAPAQVDLVTIEHGNHGDEFHHFDTLDRFIHTAPPLALAVSDHC